jgi:hypothetical protein
MVEAPSGEISQLIFLSFRVDARRECVRDAN